MRLDIIEGADILLVKPALPGLDLIAAAKAAFDVPVAAYQVSGEYAMLMAAAQNGWLDGRRATTEAVAATPAGRIVITYAAPDLATWLRENDERRRAGHIQAFAPVHPRRRPATRSGVLMVAPSATRKRRRDRRRAKPPSSIGSSPASTSSWRMAPSSTPSRPRGATPARDRSLDGVSHSFIGRIGPRSTSAARPGRRRFPGERSLRIDHPFTKSADWAPSRRRAGRRHERACGSATSTRRPQALAYSFGLDSRDSSSPTRPTIWWRSAISSGRSVGRAAAPR